MSCNCGIWQWRCAAALRFQEPLGKLLQAVIAPAASVDQDLLDQRSQTRFAPPVPRRGFRSRRVASIGSLEQRPGSGLIESGIVPVGKFIARRNFLGILTHECSGHAER
jgi:hypothetical protein